MVDGKFPVRAAGVVILITLVFWLVLESGLLGPEKTFRVQQAASNFIEEDIDSDGKTERIWVAEGDARRPSWLIVLKDGRRYVASERIGALSAGFILPKVWEIAPGKKAVGAWYPTEGGGAAIEMFTFEKGAFFQLGSFFGEQGAEVVDLDGDQKAEVILFSTNEDNPAELNAEVYTLRGRKYVFDASLSGGAAEIYDRPTRP
ncbi:MAG TPA: hypothetical protein DCY84_07885 [Firmicutes bacterium]|nr:hypothetical protein [Bacillota bacterium]